MFNIFKPTKAERELDKRADEQWLKRQISDSDYGARQAKSKR